MEGGSVWSGVASWAEKAKKVVAEQAQATYSTVNQGAPADLELGEGVDRFASWARGAADRARSSFTDVASQATAGDWANHAKAWQGDLATTFGKVSETAAKAGAGFAENAKVAQQKAALAASSAKDGLAKAGAGLGGIGALAMSPVKLAQFAGLFMLGFMLISLSLSFLPLLPINPAKFALLFALGSLTMLGSVAFLRGPQAFFAIALQRDKMPFTVCYGVGLLGTFWATLIARSYPFTGVFAFMQAVGLLYFLASFVPGGKSVLNFFGRLSGRAARAVFRSGTGK